MKIIVLLLSLFCFTKTYTQRKYTFASDYQVDKVGNGSIKSSKNFVTIQFTDPSSITPDTDAGYDNLPEGDLIIKFHNLNEPIRDRIRYFGKYLFNKKFHNFYGISYTETDANGMYFIKDLFNEKGKTYNYMILIGYFNANKSSKPLTYTMFYCN